MQVIGAITFDFHDTLVHCDAWFELEIRSLVSSYLVWDAGRRGTTISDETLADADAAYRRLRITIVDHGVEEPAERCVALVLAELGLHRDGTSIAAGVEDLMRATLDGAEATPGAVETVLALHAAGVPLGVVSSAVYHPFIEWSLSKLGIRDRFVDVTTSASAGFYKSRPEIYLHAVDRLGFKPEAGRPCRGFISMGCRRGPGRRAPSGMDRERPSRPRRGPTARSHPDLPRRCRPSPPGVAPKPDSMTASAKLPATVRSGLIVDIFTLFPAMFRGPFDESIVRRARESGAIDIRIHDIRDWTHDRHRTADDTPYGGGAGMVMVAPPIVAAVEETLGDDLPKARVLLMAAGGRLYDQRTAASLATANRIAIVCGRYEGIDQRVVEVLGAEEVSVGDYVLTGGELPAMVVVDAVARLLPGVIHASSVAEESHQRGLVEYPHYTRPHEFRGLMVPPVLLSGHHGEVARWRRVEAIRRTAALRPDLLSDASLSEDERLLVEEVRREANTAGTASDQTGPAACG
jgi:tRNA (guanine37-N1)-methyltransferase